MNTKNIEDVRGVLWQFQDGYNDRDLDHLDAFIKLFVQDGEPELIIAKESDHLIPEKQPEIIIETLKEVIKLTQ